MEPPEDIRLLFLGSGPYPFNRRRGSDKFHYFSRYYAGDFISPVYPATLRTTRLKSVELEKNFTLYPFSYYYGSAIIKNLSNIFHYLTKALKLYYIEKKKFQIVISGNPLMTGLCALIIAKLTGAKSIIEVNGNFESAFKYGRLGETEAGFMEKVRDKVAKYLIRFTLQKADAVRLLYNNQLDTLYKNRIKLKNIPTFSFSDFVPVKYFLNEEKSDNKYILLVGFPWYLKGVDILIKAFNKISKGFPDYRLKIVGWCPRGREYFENLAKDNSRIDLCEPVPYKDVIPLFLGCSLYVLASRTEAMGKVLLEAMASRKPIIASNVGGVHAVIKDGYNGLLFETENVEDLAEKIKLVLTDNDLAEKLAQNGYQYVQEKLSEENYINNYSGMIEEILGVN